MSRYFLIFILVFSFAGYGRSISDSLQVLEFPDSYQLFTRGADDSSSVPVKVAYHSQDAVSLLLEVYKNDSLITSFVQTDTSQEKEIFEVFPKISAELSQYSFSLWYNDSLIMSADSVVCGDAYIIAGQSNAVAVDFEYKSTYTSPFIRSFGTLHYDSATCANDTLWGIATSFSGKKHLQIGVWGMKMVAGIVDSFDVPVCVINGAVSSTPIEAHQKDESQPLDLSTIYGRLLYRTSLAGVNDGVKGLVWWQGESNEPEGYADKFLQLYDTWKKDYPAIKKFYIVQLQQGCGTWKMTEMCDVQRRIAEDLEDADLMVSAGINDRDQDHCHYGYEGYTTFGKRMFKLIANEFYDADFPNIHPPKIQYAYIDSDEKQTVVLRFDQDIFLIEPDSVFIKDYIYFDGEYGVVDSLYMKDNEVFLMLKHDREVSTVSYSSPRFYHGTSTYYQGPWLRNVDGLPAAIFYKYPIETTMHLERGTQLPETYALKQNYPNPFNPQTNIPFEIPEKSFVRIEIYTIEGQFIDNVVMRALEKGAYSVSWHSKNIASGVLIYRLVAESLESGKTYNQSRLMLKLK